MKAILTTPVFDSWLRSLSDRPGAFRIRARIDRAQDGHFGDWAYVGDGVREMRIDFGPGYRVYFVERATEIVILLAGGDKSTQRKDIATAKRLANEI